MSKRAETCGLYFRWVTIAIFGVAIVPLNHDDRPWCDPNEKCSAKKFRNIIEVNYDLITLRNIDSNMHL